MKENDMKMIGARIKLRREEVGLTQDELARNLGYKSRSSINKIELGKQNIKQSALVKIALALNVTPGYILGDKPKDNTSQEPTKYDTDRPYIPLSESESALLDLYRSMNEEGREKLLDYADDLVRSGKYDKRDYPLPMEA